MSFRLNDINYMSHFYAVTFDYLYHEYIQHHKVIESFLLHRLQINHQRPLLPQRKALLLTKPILLFIHQLQIKLIQHLCKNKPHLRIRKTRNHHGLAYISYQQQQR